MANVRDYDFIVSEFELHSCYYIHFRLVIWLFEFHGISNTMGYSMPNTVYIYELYMICNDFYMNSLFLCKLTFLLNSCFDPFDPQVGPQQAPPLRVRVDPLQVVIVEIYGFA